MNCFFLNLKLKIVLEVSISQTFEQETKPFEFTKRSQVVFIAHDIQGQDIQVCHVFAKKKKFASNAQFMMQIRRKN